MHRSRPSLSHSDSEKRPSTTCSQDQSVVALSVISSPPHTGLRLSTQTQMI